MPTAAATPTRERIVQASAELFRRQGYAGTGLKQIVTEAQAPFGSIYHFLPGGKEEFAEEVLRTGGAFFLALYEAIAAEHDGVRETLAAFFAGAAETLVATGYADACPIATVADEIASTHETLRIAAADVIASWLAALQRDLGSAGVPARQAGPLALAVLAQLEGAFLLCRTTRELAPMRAATAAAVLVLSALSAAKDPR